MNMGYSASQSLSFGGHGMRTVASAGTAVQLVATNPTGPKAVLIKAHNANTGVVYVGLSTVDATLDAGNVTCGYHLAANQETPWIPVPSDDLTNIFIDADTNDSDVTFMWLV